ncbi:unnamed protein product, partial [Notodromas monacha]
NHSPRRLVLDDAFSNAMDFVRTESRRRPKHRSRLDEHTGVQMSPVAGTPPGGGIGSGRGLPRPGADWHRVAAAHDPLRRVWRADSPHGSLHSRSSTPDAKRLKAAQMRHGVFGRHPGDDLRSPSPSPSPPLQHPQLHQPLQPRAFRQLPRPVTTSNPTLPVGVRRRLPEPPGTKPSTLSLRTAAHAIAGFNFPTVSKSPTLATQHAFGGQLSQSYINFPKLNPSPTRRLPQAVGPATLRSFVNFASRQLPSPMPNGYGNKAGPGATATMPRRQQPACPSPVTGRTSRASLPARPPLNASSSVTGTPSVATTTTTTTTASGLADRNDSDDEDWC